jgi:hypothetical protein
MRRDADQGGIEYNPIGGGSQIDDLIGSVAVSIVVVGQSPAIPVFVAQTPQNLASLLSPIFWLVGIAAERAKAEVSLGPWIIASNAVYGI